MDTFPCTGRVCLVAELSANHNGSLERAEALVRAAADAGADAIKLQTYTADTMTLDLNRAPFRIKSGLWAGRTLYDLYSEASMPWAWQPRLKTMAEDLGMACFSTPFDTSAVAFLETLNVPCHKVASFEIVDLPLLRAIAATGKPVIVSTGMATLADIDEAVRTLRENGAGKLTLLKCTSAYPAPPEETHLRTIPHLAQAFGCSAGLSDHTMGASVAVAAVALGACMVEKHFTLSRTEGGPDAAFSMEPHEFKHMVGNIRTVEQALGRVCYERTAAQRDNIMFRRSLFVVRDVRKGTVLTEAEIRSIRPGDGLPPCCLDMVLGRRARRDLAAGTPLAWDMLA